MAAKSSYMGLEAVINLVLIDSYNCWLIIVQIYYYIINEKKYHEEGQLKLW